MDYEEQIRKRVKCCVCEGSLEHSKYINIVALTKIATWDFPTAGNVFIPDAPNQAVAFVCDDCIRAAPRNNMAAHIKYAVEATDDCTTIIYHNLDDLLDEPESVRLARERLSQLNYPNPTMN